MEIKSTGSGGWRLGLASAPPGVSPGVLSPGVGYLSFPCPGFPVPCLSNGGDNSGCLCLAVPRKPLGSAGRELRESSGV